MGNILFYIFAVLTIAAALVVVSHKNTVTSAISLVLVLFSTAALFVLLSAPFIAVIQVLVYAGAIMVLFIFTVMFLNLRENALSFDTDRILPKFVVLALILVATGVVAHTVFKSSLSVGSLSAAAPEGFGSVKGVSTLLFTDYILPFELTSILIVVAIIGVVTIALKRSN